MYSATVVRTMEIYNGIRWQATFRSKIRHMDCGDLQKCRPHYDKLPWVVWYGSNIPWYRIHLTEYCLDIIQEYILVFNHAWHKLHNSHIIMGHIHPNVHAPKTFEDIFHDVIIGQEHKVNWCICCCPISKGLPASLHAVWTCSRTSGATEPCNLHMTNNTLAVVVC